MQHAEVSLSFLGRWCLYGQEKEQGWEWRREKEQSRRREWVEKEGVGWERWRFPVAVSRRQQHLGRAEG